MNLNVVVALIVSILTAAGVNTSNIDIDSIKNKVINEATVENTGRSSDTVSTYSNNDATETSEDDNDAQDDAEEPTLEEKYQHNANRGNQSEDEEYCDGDGFGIEYVCNKCGYSYTVPISEEEFMEGLDDEDE